MKKLIIILSIISIAIGTVILLDTMLNTSTMPLFIPISLGIFNILGGTIGLYVALGLNMLNNVSDRYDEGWHDGARLSHACRNAQSIVNTLPNEQYNQLLYDLLHSDTPKDISNVTKKEYMPMVTNAQIAGHSDSKDYYQEVIAASKKNKEHDDNPSKSKWGFM